MLNKIQEAGVVGAGGAGFPTHVKYQAEAEVFIVNAIECEPLLRVDRCLVERRAPELVAAARQIAAQLKASRTVIAVKAHNADMVSALQSAAAGTGVELFLSPSVYPAGDEQNLIHVITGRVVPTGGLPLDVGCVVSNAATVFNVYRALQGKPVTARLVTVGGAVAKPVTVLAPIGLPMERLLPLAGGTAETCVFIIGGPLMGRVVEDLSGESVTKISGGLLAIPKGHRLLSYKRDDFQWELRQARAACCQCSMCTQLCPRNAMGLNVQPHKIMRALAAGNMELAGTDGNGVFSCCDCGICTYFACNFGLHPSKMMQRCKGKLAGAGRKPVKEVRYAPQGFDVKRLPTERLLGRLDLAHFDMEAPYVGPVETDVVRIPFKMHVGAPCVPSVSEGDAVSLGQKIAGPNGLGANIHASIAGRVTQVTQQYIEIRK